MHCVDEDVRAGQSVGHDEDVVSVRSFGLLLWRGYAYSKCRSREIVTTNKEAKL